MKSVEIFDRKIGKGYPPYIVAELSANHNGSLETALKTIGMAKNNGADAIKIQTYTPDTMTIDSNGSDFQITDGLWSGYSLYNLYKKAHTPYAWHEEIFNYARKLEITCFSSPFDESAVDFLEDLNCPAYKIASFEAIDLPLISYASQTGKPIVISTGMATLNEIHEAVDTAKSAGCKDLILLHCISAYPAAPEECNLLTIKDLEKKFNIVVGLSDHTMGTAVSVASIALGASFVEKHVTLSRSANGPDSSFSLEPNELKKLCHDSKVAWSALGGISYSNKSEEDSLKHRRSVYIVKDMKVGEILTLENMRRIRPGFGVKPKYYQDFLGRAVKVDVSKGTALSFDMVDIDESLLP